MCVDRSLQSSLLRRVVCRVFCPYTHQDLGASSDGGRDGVLEGVAVRAGIEADGGDVLRQALKLVEGRLPLCLGFARAVCVVRSYVETLPVGGGEGKGGRDGREGGGETHAEELWSEKLQ